MSVTGTWKNSYGSVMALVQSAEGFVFGTYQSSTGSSGTYFVTGFAQPNGPASSLGESLALSIFWRSITGGTGDPSWHWVSGLGGQRVPSSGTDAPPTLNLIHAMVATDDFPGLANVGTYLDKLVYLPVSPSAPALEKMPVEEGSLLRDRIEETWICQQDSAVTLKLQVASSKFGLVTGKLTTAGGAHEVSGFTDTYAQQGGLSLQGLSVCALLGDGGWTVALAGSLDHKTRVMTLTQLLNHGTTPTATYVQTKLATWTFVRKA